MRKFWVLKSAVGFAIFIGSRMVYRNSIKNIEKEIREGEAEGQDMTNRRVYLAHFKTIPSL